MDIAALETLRLANVDAAVRNAARSRDADGVRRPDRPGRGRRTAGRGLRGSTKLAGLERGVS